MRCRTMIVLACVAALFVAAAHAEVVGASRGLKKIVVQKGQFADQPIFPYCVCRDYSPSSSPYTFHLIDNADTTSVLTGEMCFVIKYRGPSQRPSACYTALEDRLYKIHLSVQPACPPAFTASGSYVSINGVQKTTAIQVQTYPLGSVIILANLHITSQNATGTKVCVRAAFPCNIAENLFTAVPVPIAVIESSSHKCCPAAGHF